MSKSNKDNANYEEVIQDFSYLVMRIARHVASRVPSMIQIDDLVQAGMIGLIEAFNRFDYSKGASFITYAGIRIRGSMIDELRRGDWVPRSVYRKSRDLMKEISKLEHELGRESTDKEVALFLDIPLNKYYKMLNNISGYKFLEYEEGGLCEELITSYLLSYMNNPMDVANIADILEKVTKEISTLPEQEYNVLSMYYDNDMNLREIGKILGITESRVSQVHNRGLIRLQSKLNSLIELGS